MKNHFYNDKLYLYKTYIKYSFCKKILLYFLQNVLGVIYFFEPEKEIFMKIVGQKLKRVDAVAKATGEAKYTGDFAIPGMLVAKVLHSNFAHGMIKSFDLDEALKVPGVIKIFTCFDVPEIQFPTAGHPWSVEPAHQDVGDRHLLNKHVRFYGDDIAVVVAKDEVAAKRALRLIKFEYDEYPFYLEPEEALAEDAIPLHEDIRPTNLFVRSTFKVGEGDFDELKEEYTKSGQAEYFKGKYGTSNVSHCHIEPPISRAYIEGDKIIIVSSTQIPHIMRRVIGQALGMPWGKFRVIKPYIGGGFGNKQDVLYEPLNAWLTIQLGGRPVELDVSREETFISTRMRHAISAEVEALVTPEGRLIARRYNGLSNKGAYASHGHAVTANCANEYRMMYQDEVMVESAISSVYTNRGTAGAMRAYGIPQGAFIMESQMDDIALKLGVDPIKIRKLNMMKPGYVDPTTGITAHSSGLEECIDRGAKYIGWEEKRKAYGKEPLNRRRGVGMSIFCYKTGVYPISLESASARILLNQDGSVQLHVGATEIGQGADTVFSQIAAENIGISFSNVHIVSTQDTDVSPYDSGAYASRQTYVSGGAVKKTAILFKQKVLENAEIMLGIKADKMDIVDDNIINKETGEIIRSMEEFSMEAIYSLKHSAHIEAQATNDCKQNTFSFGVCFVDLEVDCYLGKITIHDIINVHDSGRLINPALAEAQIHGGMSMGLGYGLNEAYSYDKKTGKMQNPNLLDYKMLTSMDHPDLHCDFVEAIDPDSHSGNKSLGEPPTVPVAPAIRNAILHATGVHINMLPCDSRRIVATFMEAGLIDKPQE